MRVLIFWDVYGRIWRAALKKELPLLKEKHKPDFVIVNVDNCTSWRWPIEKHLLEFEALWVDLMTWGNHVFDNLNKIDEYIEKEDSKLIRPANFREYKEYKSLGKWYKVIEKNWKKLLVIHILWEVFMHMQLDNPFLKVEEIIEELKWEDLDWIIIDYHKETSAEWYWLAHFLDWRASFIYWTHTHVQTNDELILENGIWLLSDVWMNWSLYSIIWADYKAIEKRFLTWWRWKITQCLDKNYLVNWVVVDIWDDMRCENIEKIRIKGKLI